MPEAVAAVDTFTDPVDACLLPEEEPGVARAVAKRRMEYTTVRVLARAALGRIGIPPAPILRGERGAPCWPDGVVGSLTHCAGYRAAAVARAGELAALGIDAEPNGPLPDGVRDAIAFGDEQTMLDTLGIRRPEVCWDRLLFSAKESVYKAWYPMTARWLNFEDAAVTIDPDAGTFTARLLVDGPVPGYRGRWLTDHDLVCTAIAVPR